MCIYGDSKCKNHLESLFYANGKEVEYEIRK